MQPATTELPIWSQHLRAHLTNTHIYVWYVGKWAIFMATALLDAVPNLNVNESRLTQQSNYGIIASCAFLVYDVILVLADEIDHVWKAKWSFPKLLYLFNRYFGIVYLVITTTISLRAHNSYKICRLYYYLTSFGGINLFAALANIINTIRIHALYNKNRTVLIIFLLLLTGQYVLGLWVSVNITQTTATITSTDDFPGCSLFGPTPRGMLAVWILNLLNTSIAFFFTIWDFAWSVKQLSYPASSLRKKGFGAQGVRPLLWIFVQDGSVHYVSVVAALLFFLVLTIIEQSPLSPMACSWLVAMYSFSATRLILNIRIYAARQRGGAATWQQAFSIRIEDTIQEGILNDEDAEDAMVLNSCELRAQR